MQKLAKKKENTLKDFQLSENGFVFGDPICCSALESCLQPTVLIAWNRNGVVFLTERFFSSTAGDILTALSRGVGQSFWERMVICCVFSSI